MLKTASDARDLWAAYNRDTRPPNIADRVDGVVLADVDDEIQDVVGTYMAMEDDVGSWRAARLGLALNEVTRILPHIEPRATQDYFGRLAEMARATLAAMAAR